MAPAAYLSLAHALLTMNAGIRMLMGSNAALGRSYSDKSCTICHGSSPSRPSSTSSSSSSRRQHYRRPQLSVVCQAGRSNPAAGVAATALVAAPPSSSNSSTSASRLAAPERLRDPAQIGARGTATANVWDQAGDTSLHAYMTLPVEQYYILDPSKVQFIEGNKFILSVPCIQLLGASLEPVIEVQVRSERDAVLLEATDCKLNATGIMGGLDSKFALKFSTRLTWKSQQQQQQQQRQSAPLLGQQQPAAGQRSTGSSSGAAGTGNGQQPASAQPASGWAALRNLSWPPKSAGNNSSTSSSSRPATSPAPASPAPAAAATSTPGSITGSALVQVWCEVVPPFHLMPREVLEGSLNSVLTGLINSLLPWFMQQLAADYQKWAADESYRAARRLRSSQRYQSN